MSAFKDSDQLVEFWKSLFETLKAETDFCQIVERAGIKLKFVFADPDAEMWYGAGADAILAGDEIDQDADVVMTGLADHYHAVWSKEMPLTKALATKKLRVKGPTMGIMKLTSSVGPIFDKYPDHCRKFGIQL